MQSDNPDYHRHQLVEALNQCGHHLRTTASVLDSYVAFLQSLPHPHSGHASTAAPVPAQNMFQMFTPPQTGTAHPGAGVAHAPGTTNGVSVPILPQAQAIPAAPTRGRKRRAAPGDPNASPELNADGTKKRRRRVAGEKKEKDPNAPKRPPSAYLLFQNEVREEMKKLYPDRPYLEVLNKISERWAGMNETDKKSYVDAINDLRAKFEVDKAAYDASHNAPSGEGQNGTSPTGAVSSSPTVPAAPTVPTPAPAVAPPAPAALKPTPAPAPATTSPDEDDEEEEDEASSQAAVSEAVRDAAERSSTDSSSDVNSSSDESSEGDTDEEKQVKPIPTKTGKKGESEKPVSKSKTTPATVPTPAKGTGKPVSSTKEKEGKKSKKTKKN